VVVAILAAASMAGVAPLLGFVAKEAVISTLLDAASAEPLWAWTALLGTIVGSILTVAYSVRFVWGAFWTKAAVEPTRVRQSPPAILIAPASLALFGLVTGLAPGLLGPVFEPYASAFREA